MRRSIRTLATLLIVLGIGTLAWVFVTWKWEDPVTALVTRYEQGKLESAYERRLADLSFFPERRNRSPTGAKREIRRAATEYRIELRTGDPVGRLRVSKLGLNAIVVEGTDPGVLKRGPGRHRATSVPGAGRLTYVAGHRTTYGAPFADIDKLERGDRVLFEMPYGAFEYSVTGRRIVPATYVQALRSRGREELALQACWPRFFASQRIIVYARAVSVRLPGASNAVALRPKRRTRPARS